jgi:hypothetical protein
MSRLHQILFVGGDTGARIMDESLRMVLRLCCNDSDAQKEIAQAIRMPFTSPTDYSVPDNFTALVRKIQPSGNAHYKQFLILAFMLFNPSEFGMYMLQGEAGHKSDEFMKYLKEAIGNYIRGVHIDGSPFRSDEAMTQRKAGSFMAALRTQFVTL